MIIESALQILSKKLQEEAVIAGVSTLAPAKGSKKTRVVDMQVQNARQRYLNRHNK